MFINKPDNIFNVLLGPTLHWATRSAVVSRRILILFSLMAVWGDCIGADPGVVPFTPESIKRISRNINAVALNPQITPGTYLVEIDFHKDPFVGGGQDWNSISNEVWLISKRLLLRSETARIYFKFISPKNKNFQWASVMVRRDKLPHNWDELTYHQFFGRSEPLPGSVETGRWLCEHYKKYRSSQPAAGLPFYCSLKD